MSVLCEINETEEIRIGKFIGGLREDFRQKLKILQILTFETTCSIALVYEKYAKKKPNTTYRTSQTKTNASTSTLTATRTDITKQKPMSKVLTHVKDVVCFKCHGTGHYKNECSNGSAFTATEWAEINERTGPRAMLVHKDAH